MDFPILTVKHVISMESLEGYLIEEAMSLVEHVGEDLRRTIQPRESVIIDIKIKFNGGDETSISHSDGSEVPWDCRATIEQLIGIARADFDRIVTSRPIH